MAGPSRLLWLAMLLFGFLYTHGISGESAVSHSTGSPVAMSTFEHIAKGHEAQGDSNPGAVSSTALKQDDTNSHHGNDETVHAAEECASGKPQEGPDFFAPGCSTPFDTAAALSTPAGAAVSLPASAPESPSSAAVRILRI
ncbi:DUF6153 family protein [Streptomyces sp. UNOB3_S3]|uniref:DUF6153 family protein n=1 Tax=Streptomyces sp. UNOB3_S3 TaxID=2871682 RepID=UPI001E2E3023|nr:DUF6153 family protein [Streptomyces sp. UNOB3_S3]MCC3779903.1 hypothetical protein [Streptomyces sp. UNOB3_S3]